MVHCQTEKSYGRIQNQTSELVIRQVWHPVDGKQRQRVRLSG